jgi:uncharacterized membrane protein
MATILSMQMGKIQAQITINSPVEKVFTYTASPSNGPAFIPNLNENTNITPKETQVGQTWDWKFNMVGVDLNGSSQVYEMKKPTTWKLKTKGAVQSDWKYSFTAIDADTTNVTLEVEYEIPTAMKLATPIIEKINQHNANNGLTNLKTILESLP